MNVVEPSPSSEIRPVSSAVPMTTLAGSLPTSFRMPSTSLSKSPTSIMMPKYMMANMSRAAVPDIDLTASITMSPMPRPAPAKRPKMVGTMISASNGVMRLVMMSAMNVATIRNPSATSMGISLGMSGWGPCRVRSFELRPAVTHNATWARSRSWCCAHKAVFFP